MNDAQADGTGANDKHEIISLHSGAFDRMGADAEGFHEGELIERKDRRCVQFRRGNADEWSHAAIDVDSENLKAFAAVWFSPPARGALAAIEIRLNRTAVADGKAVAIRTEGNDLHAEFVAEDSWILEKWLPAVKCVKVGSANANPMDSNDRIERTGCGIGGFAGRETAGFRENYMFHDGAGKRGFQEITALRLRQWRIVLRGVAPVRG